MVQKSRESTQRLPFSPAYLSPENQICVLQVRPRFGWRLACVAAELRADIAEGGIQALGQRTHASGGAERDQSNDKGVLDQVLAFVAAQQILKLQVPLEK